MSLRTNYRRDAVYNVTMHGVTAVTAHSFRANGEVQEPFVTIHVTDGTGEVVLFLTHALALELGVLLYKLPLEATPDP